MFCRLKAESRLPLCCAQVAARVIGGRGLLCCQGKRAAARLVLTRYSGLKPVETSLKPVSVLLGQVLTGFRQFPTGVDWIWRLKARSEGFQSGGGPDLELVGLLDDDLHLGELPEHRLAHLGDALGFLLV